MRRAALRVLLTADPAEKAARARRLGLDDDGRPVADALVDTEADLDVPLDPGRLPLPRLVPFAALPRRSAHTPQGRAALLHAVAHIELNAIEIKVHIGPVPGYTFATWWYPVGHQWPTAAQALNSTAHS